MDLSNLRSLKAIRPQSDDPYAYADFKRGQFLRLQWKEDKTNAAKAQKNELTLLKQQGYITHLVRIADDSITVEHPNEWGIYRIAEVLWVADCQNLPDSLKATNVFDFGFEGIQGGSLMRFETMHSTFQERWPGSEGLAEFHERVNGLLQ